MSYSVKYEDIGLKDFKETWDYQAEIFREIVDNKKSGKGCNTMPGTLIFVEHPHVYTLGKSGSENNLLLDYIQLRAKDAKFYRIDRGGDITYHGPGQIVGYPIFDLEAIRIGLKEYISRLEEAILKTIGEYGLSGSRLEGGTGVWLDPDIQGKARKICAIGVKASRFVTMHGFAFNVNTDLTYFNHINPCGFTDKGTTSLEKEMGMKQNIEKVKNIVRKKLGEVFDLNWTNINS
ncbi:MAG: Octanoyltransferase [Bacteroidota bacterium]|nr:Octanoyltransferase [Bacteroidota bacterium]